MPPLVSIIIPTHNRNIELKRAIQSVLNQTFKDYEIIVIDDTWSTLEISDDYPNVRFLYIPITPYPAVSRNAGIKVSTGEYIAFLDDDDIWYPHKLELQISFLKYHSEIGMVCSNGNAGNDLYIKRLITTKSDMLPQEILGDFVVTSSCVIRRDLLEKTGLYNPLPLCEDYDFSIRFAAISRIFYDPHSFFGYTISQDSIQNRSSGSFIEYHKNILNVMKITKEFLKTNNLETPKTSLLIWYRIVTTQIIIMYNIMKDKVRGV